MSPIANASLVFPFRRSIQSGSNVTYAIEKSNGSTDFIQNQNNCSKKVLRSSEFGIAGTAQ